MELKNNLIGWVEIPVQNMERAKKFYEEIFQIELTLHDLQELVMAWFPSAGDAYGSTCSLVYHKDFYSPSEKGVLVYFSSIAGDLAIEMSRLESAGGELIVPKRQISPEHGYMSIFKDSEGNRIGIHSSK